MITLNSGIGNYVESNGKKYSYFGGNNYLGLANHPDIKTAAIQVIKKYGVNFSASRHTTGTADVHLQLEKQLSAFKGKQDTVVFASGYQGNSIVLEVLKDRYSAVFIDQCAHPSILSGIPRDISNVFHYNHCDADHLEFLLNRHYRYKPLIITDGIFALTGEITPLDRIYPLVEKRHGILIIDDAHSTGILGRNGRGTPEHFELPEDGNIFQTETMSKALGSYGGFISGNKSFTDLIRDKSTTYQASTALPPPIVAAGMASVRIIMDNPGLRRDLLDKALKIREEITRIGFQTTKDNTPIIPVIFPASDIAISLSCFMEDNGIITPLMHYPVRQEIHLIRITVTADHTADQIEILLELLKKWKKKYGKNRN